MIMDSYDIIVRVGPLHLLIFLLLFTGYRYREEWVCLLKQKEKEKHIIESIVSGILKSKKGHV